LSLLSINRAPRTDRARMLRPSHLKLAAINTYDTRATHTHTVYKRNDVKLIILPEILAFTTSTTRTRALPRSTLYGHYLPLDVPSRRVADPSQVGEHQMVDRSPFREIFSAPRHTRYRTRNARTYDTRYHANDREPVFLERVSPSPPIP